MNAIAYYIQTDEKNFEEFFSEFNAKAKKSYAPKVDKAEKDTKEEKNSINLLGNKRAEPDNNEKEKINEEKNNKTKMELKIPMFAKNEEEPEKDEKMLELDDIINEMMKLKMII